MKRNVRVCSALQWLSIQLSHSVMPDFAILQIVAHQAPLSMGFNRQEHWSVLPCPPPGIFSTQGSNPHLLHYRRILYCWATGEAQMGYVEVKVAQLCPTLWDPMAYTVHGILQGRIRDWVAVPFSRGSSQPSDRTQISRIAGAFFTNWAIREAQSKTCSVVSNSSQPLELYSPWNSPG